jgi:transposase
MHIRCQGSFPNTLAHLGAFARRLDPHDQVVLECTSNAYLIHDILAPFVSSVKVAHAAKVKLIAEARLKSDKVDAEVLGRLLAADFIPQVWVPPHEIRDLRNLVGHWQLLKKMSTMMKNKIHAVLMRQVIGGAEKNLFSKKGQQWLRRLSLAESEALQRETAQAILAVLKEQQRKLERYLAEKALAYPEVKRLMQIPGISVFSATAIIAEIGEIKRFASAKKLCSYAGVVPSLHQSGQVTRTGRITKAGRKRLRWIMVQCANVAVRHDKRLGRFYGRLARKKGHNVAIVAVARKMLVMIWHILRGENYEDVDQRLYSRKLVQLAWKAGREAARSYGGSKGLVAEGLRELGLHELARKVANGELGIGKLTKGKASLAG